MFETRIYWFCISGKLRQFQGNSIEEEIEEQEVDSIMPCLAIRDNSCLDTKVKMNTEQKNYLTLWDVVIAKDATMSRTKTMTDSDQEFGYVVTVTSECNHVS